MKRIVLCGPDELMAIAKEEGLMTDGWLEQRQKVGILAMSGITLEELAMAIWICSDHRKFSLADIRRILKRRMIE